MADAATLSVLIQAKDQASQAIEKVSGSMNKLADGFAKHRRTIGMASTAIGGSIMALAATAVKSSLEQRIGIQQLDMALKNVGTSYLAQKNAIETVVSAQQNKTNYGDEVQRKVLIRLVGVLGDHRKALQALPVVLDAAAFSGKEVTTVVETMSKFLAGLANNSDATGVKVDALATFQQRLAEVTAVVGGQAEAAADPVLQLANRMGDLHQVVGDAILPLTEMAQDIEGIVKKAIEWSEANPKLSGTLVKIGVAAGAILAVFGPILLLLPGLKIAILALVPVFLALNASMFPVTAIVMGLTAAIIAGFLIWKNWDLIVEKVTATLAVVIKSIYGAAKAVLNFMKSVADFIPGMGGMKKAIDRMIISLDKQILKTDEWAKKHKIGAKDVAQSLGSAEDDWEDMADTVSHETANAITANQGLQNEVRNTADTFQQETEKMSEAQKEAVRIAEMNTIIYGKEWQKRLDQMDDFADDARYIQQKRIAEEARAAEEVSKIKDQLNRQEEERIAALNKVLDKEREVQQEVFRINEEKLEQQERLRADWAKVGEAFDETLNKWKEGSFKSSDVVAAWATAMNTNTDAVENQLARLGVETDDVHRILEEFAKATGHDFFEWAEKTGLAIDKNIAKLSEFEKLTGMKSPLHGMTRDIDKEGLTYEERLAERRKGTMFDPAVKKAFDAVGVESSDFADYAREAIRKGGGTDIFGSQKFGRTITDEEGRKMTAATHSITSGVSANDIRRAASAAMSAGLDPFKAAVESAQKQQKEQLDEISAKGLDLATHSASGIPMKAGGGFAGGLTMVGERGPELVSLPGGSFVHPSGSGPGGVVNQFHFHGAVYGVEDLKEAVVEAVRDHAISGGFSGVFAEA
jgi:uncharacterized membrane protein